MLENIKQYVAGCKKCQANKPNWQSKTNNLYPNEILQGPWETISIDLIGPLPKSAGYDGILVIVDHFSKMAHYMPINMNITTHGVAKVSWDRVFKDVGIPQKVISDRGPQFVSRFMKELCSQLGIERNPSTAYHPQTNGQTERVNQELEQYLQLYCNYRQNDWAEWLSIAEFSYNNWIHSSIGQSPFMINLGCHPNVGGNMNSSMEDSPGTEQFLKTIKEIRSRVEVALKKTNKVIKKK